MGRIRPGTRALPHAVRGRSVTHRAVSIRHWLMITLIEQAKALHFMPGRWGVHGRCKGRDVGCQERETRHFHPETWSGWSPAAGDGDLRVGSGLGVTRDGSWGII